MNFSHARTLILLLAALFGGALMIALLSPQPEKPYLSSRSDERDGALALRLWLERAGYQVQDAVTIPNDLAAVDALFVLEPFADYTPADAAALRRWVESGNTLIIAGSPFSVGTLIAEFGLKMRWLYTAPEQFAPTAPTLNQPPVGALPRSFTSGITTEREGVVPHIFNGTAPILVSFHQGAGMVWVSGLVEPFTNTGIQNEMNARLILNLLAGVPKGARIAFDEGLYAFGSVNTLNDWLFGTPPGWGVLLVVGVTFAYLLMRGRRFGRPVPLLEEKLRREPVEYIQAIASLFRRVGGRDDMLKHYRTQFRRRLSARYGVDPRLPDAEFARHIVYRDPTLDEAALRALLARLAQPGVSERGLLDAAHEVDSWLRKMS